MNRIHNNIRILRKLNELSQENAAFELGISQSQYSRRENGSIEFTISELIKLSKLLNVSYENIIEKNYSENINNKLSHTTTILPAENNSKDHRIVELLLNVFDVLLKNEMRIEEKSHIINTIKSRLENY